MKLLLLFVLLILLSATTAKESKELNVYIVPNSHCDAGWLKTTEEYYDIVVKNILTNTINLLIRDKKAKFIWVETIFFSKWWNEQNESMKKKFKELLSETKQIEFVLGGWVMNDDACPTYTSIINQITLGNQWLHHEFGIIPKIGWQIDPFGLSSVMAGLYKRMNFKYHIIARIDYKLKNKLRNEKAMEFNWSTSKNSNNTDIFTHILYDSYCTFSPVDWEGSYPWGYNPRENPPLTPENIDKIAKLYVEKIKERAKAYKTNNYLHTYGCDFTFREPERMFGNMSLLIDYINQNKPKFNMNLKYSLLSEYFEAIEKEKEISWPKRNEEDFFSYKDNDASYWTGYFTSYPHMKKMTRSLEALLKSSELLSFSSKIDANRANEIDFEKILMGQKFNGEMQHHDGITGTAKKHVRDDYIKKMKKGIDSQNEVIKESLESLLPINPNDKVLIDHMPDRRLKFGVNEKSHDIMVYNTLGWNANQIVSFYSNKGNVKIFKNEFEEVDSQSIKRSDNEYEIFFETSIPPTGFHVFKVQLTSETQEPLERINSENLHDRIEFRYQVYKPYDGPGQKSGVYIFRPKVDTPIDLGDPKKETKDGKLITEEILTFPTKIQQISRYNKRLKYLDLEIKSENPLQMDNELILKIKTQIKNKRQIYTDNNGLEMKLRKYKRDTPELVAGNMYPIVYSAYINDSNSFMTVLTDKTVAGGSIKNDGEMELMLLRRTNYDDGRGVGESLDDKSLLNANLRIFYDSSLNDASSNRHYHNYLMNFPVQFFKLSNRNNVRFRRNYAFLKSELPRNINIMRMAQNGKKLFIILNHIFEKHEHHLYSKPVQHNFSAMFKHSIRRIRQKSLNKLVDCNLINFNDFH